MFDSLLRTKKYGLALGAGGPRGIVYIGVIKALEDLNIKITHIGGNSAGSLVGGLYALWQDIDKIQEIFSQYNSKTVRKLIKGDLSLNNGLFKGESFLEELDKYIGDAQISDCKIPFVSVTVDLLSGEKFYYKDGLLKDAIRASCSIPFLFKPYEKDGRSLIDGSIAENVPVDAIKSIGARKVISVNTQGFPSKKEDIKLKDIWSKVYKGIGVYMAEGDTEDADKRIHLKFDDYSFKEILNNQQKYIQMGYDETMKILN